MAKQRAIDLRLRADDPLPELVQLQRAYLAEIKHAVSYHHYQNCEARLRSFLEHQAIQDLDEITHDRVQAYITAMADRWRPSTVRGHLWAISAFCERCCAHGHLADNPCRRIRLPKIDHLPPRYLTEAEIAVLLRLAEPAGLYLPIFAALKTGLRAGELRLIEWPDILWDQGAIVIPRTKSNHPRAVPLAADLAAALQPYRCPRGPLFPARGGGFYHPASWYHLLDDLRPHIPKFSADHKGTGSGWHLLRHTFASRYVMAGGDIYRLSRILGHSTVRVTERYAHLAPAADPIVERL